MSETNESPTNSLGVVEWDELPSNSPGVSEWHDDEQEPSVSAELVASDESSSGISAFVYFFVVWMLLLILIVAAACLVAVNRCTCCSMSEVQTTTQPPNNYNSRRRKVMNGVSFAIMIAASIVGWALSLFSITTCQFVDLDAEISNLRTFLDGNYVDRITITVYSLGLWSADVTSTTAVEGCVRNILPVFDWHFNLSRASAVIASLFGGLLLLTLVMFVLAPALRIYMPHLAWFFMMTAIFQLLTLSILGSEYCDEMLETGSCRVSLGGTASVTAALCWFFLVFASTLLPFNHEATRASDETHK